MDIKNELFLKHAEVNQEFKKILLTRFKARIEETASKYFNLGKTNEEVLSYAYEIFLIYLEKCVKRENGYSIFYTNYKRNIDAYLSLKVKGIKKREYKRNKNHETRKMFFDRYRNGDINARNEIFEKYLPKALNVAKEYFDLGLENEDIVSYVYVVLLEIIDYYKNVEDVSVFFKCWKSYLNNKLINYIIREINLSHNCCGKKEKIIEFLKVRKKLINELESIPTIDMITKESGLSFVDVDYFNKCLLQIENFEIKDVYSRDFISRLINPEDIVIFKSVYTRIINDKCFTKREKEIFKLLYIENNSVKNVASIIGVSEPRVSQINKKIIEIIKEKYLDYFVLLKNVRDSLYVDEIEYSLRKSKN